MGTIAESTVDGLRVSLKFFEDIFIPAYWMLRPSKYDPNSGLWVWTPNYSGDDEGEGETEGEGEEGGQDEGDRFEMEIGSEIRFRVKSINFTRITNTAKGVQATTFTTARLEPSKSNPANGADGALGQPGTVRKRSTSLDLSDTSKIPASMHITASICEDGLGLTSWWTAPEQGGEDEGEYQEEEEDYGEEECQEEAEEEHS